jgi:molybdate transport system substrate-binding protein
VSGARKQRWCGTPFRHIFLNTAIRGESSVINLPFRRVVAVLALAALLAPGPARAKDLLVFAAASLRNALDEANAAYAGTSGGAKVTSSYLASGALAKQIANGAPADLFISADQKWMDYLAEKKLIQTDSRVDLLGNALVLVAAKDSRIQPIAIGRGTDLRSLLGDGRLVIGDPSFVPAGTYAKGALEKLGLWPGVEDKLARAENVRAALALVSRREAPLGIVYATDVAADKGTRVVGTFPADSHPPIVYPAALTATAATPAARAYLQWLESPAAATFFETQGFRVLHGAASQAGAP